MLIRNYGLFWKEEDVFWGAGSNAGAMPGVRAKAVTSATVDFREQAGVYVLYSDYQMIYVGQAGGKNQKLFKRIKQHRNDALANRWNQFSWFGTRYVKKNATLSNEKEASAVKHSGILDHIEAILIHAAEPRHNRQGGRFGESVDQYLQVRDHRLGLATDEMIKEVWLALKAQSP